MILLLTLCLVGITLLATIIGVVVIQQRRLLRTQTFLAGRLLVAQDCERAAIARDLHDDIVPRLDTVARALRASPEPASVLHGETAKGINHDLRGLARTLHPSVVDLQGLDVALQGLVAEYQGQHGMNIELAVHGNLRTLPHPMRLGLYRVAQEALRNALRYSGADHATVTLERMPHEVRLTVADNGSGFVRGEGATAAGLGLHAMQERMQMLGGRLSVRSAHQLGTEIGATVPLGEAE